MSGSEKLATHVRYSGMAAASVSPLSIPPPPPPHSPPGAGVLLQSIETFVDRVAFPRCGLSSYILTDLDDIAFIPESADWSSATPSTCIPCLFVQRPSARFVIIYFHGNGEDLGRARTFCEGLADTFDQHVLAVEYPGYGIAAYRAPNEEVVLRQADAVMSFLIEQAHWPPSRMILMGRSIGSGPACHLAARYPVAGLILVAPFTSIRAVVREKLSLLHLTFRERFDNLHNIRHVRCKVLLVHGKKDGMYSYRHSETLAAACPSETLVVLPEELTHNADILTHPRYFAQHAVKLFPLPDYCWEDLRLPEKCFYFQWCDRPFPGDAVGDGMTPQMLDTKLQRWHERRTRRHWGRLVGLRKRQPAAEYQAYEGDSDDGTSIHSVWQEFALENKVAVTPSVASSPRGSMVATPRDVHDLFFPQDSKRLAAHLRKKNLKGRRADIASPRSDDFDMAPIPSEGQHGEDVRVSPSPPQSARRHKSSRLHRIGTARGPLHSYRLATVAEHSDAVMPIDNHRKASLSDHSELSSVPFSTFMDAPVGEPVEDPAGGTVRLVQCWHGIPEGHPCEACDEDAQLHKGDLPLPKRVWDGEKWHLMYSDKTERPVIITPPASPTSRTRPPMVPRLKLPTAEAEINADERRYPVKTPGTTTEHFAEKLDLLSPPKRRMSSSGDKSPSAESGAHSPTIPVLRGDDDCPTVDLELEKLEAALVEVFAKESEEASNLARMLSDVRKGRKSLPPQENPHSHPTWTPALPPSEESRNTAKPSGDCSTPLYAPVESTADRRSPFSPPTQGGKRGSHFVQREPSSPPFCFGRICRTKKRSQKTSTSVT